MQLSIIIPTYNEEKGISKLLKHLQQAISGKISCEIIIADGGSVDQTIEEVSSIKPQLSFNVITCVSSKKGRAIQMNYGASKAQGNIYYFLHADTYPPNNFDELILGQINSDIQSGSFRMKFDKNTLFFNFWSWFTRFKWNIASGGDQSLFISGKLFNKINSYDENWPIMEDIDIISRIKKSTKYIVIPSYVTTSSRKYDEIGAFKLQAIFVSLQVQRMLGKSPSSMFDYYNKKLY